MAVLTFFHSQETIVMSKNRLPHWEQDDSTYFLTFRLADSLPSVLLSQWKEERIQWVKLNPEPWNPIQEAEYHEIFSKQKERWLDAGHGSCALAYEIIRTQVQNTILAKNGEWEIWSMVIMPNHLHVLLSLAGSRGLGRVVKMWKGRSARLINLAQGKPGVLWGKDYFDRLIRDEQHFWNCARYIRRNPVKARLAPGKYALAESDFVREILGDSA